MARLELRPHESPDSSSGSQASSSPGGRSGSPGRNRSSRRRERPETGPREALTGPGGLIYVPTDETRVDYSGELGIVMGRECQNVKAEEAADYILGYTIIHNVWAKGKPSEAIKRLLKQRKQGVRAYESFCPAGPCVVTDMDPSNVPWETRVNGEVRQKANTSEMLFGISTDLMLLKRGFEV